MPRFDRYTKLYASVQVESESSVVRLGGEWTTCKLDIVDKQLPDILWPASSRVTVDVSAVEVLDTNGAWMLNRLVTLIESDQKQVSLVGMRPQHTNLLQLVSQRMSEMEALPVTPPRGLLEKLGRNMWSHVEQFIELLAFNGEIAMALFRSLKAPSRIRWKALVSSIEHAGVHALPILGLLSFLLGIVISYQGGVQLRMYGANIFIVELVSLTMLREIAPLMVAVIVAGRTGSAYTAEIATMKVTEEVDALRTIGISPIELLVLPKMLGLIIAMPLLTVYADGLGMFGGMVMAKVMLDVSFAEFINRIPEVVSLTSFMIGIVKAPVFAALIAMVGCYQGLRVQGGADSVGNQTTISVVQAIFLVIVADAIFSVVLNWLGL